MQMELDANWRALRYGLADDSGTLFSKHYFEQILPLTKEYKTFDASDTIAQIENLIEADSFLSEADVEEEVIRPIFRALGLSYKVQAPLYGKNIDYAIYEGDAYDRDFTNTVLVVEAEHYGKLKNKYFIKRQDNVDPIAQIRNYLRGVNEVLANSDSGRTVDYGLLTDGSKWRLYSRKYTHSDRDFEQNFLEFDFAVIRSLGESEQRHYLKLFCYLLGLDGLRQRLVDTETESTNHEQAVTTELRKQVYPALEYIATGLWRRLMVDEDQGLRSLLTTAYGIAEDNIDDVDKRSDILKIVYDESLVFLLRLLFILYVEDRKITNISVIKRTGGILEAIRQSNRRVGQLDELCSSVLQSFDTDIVAVSKQIDRDYNGGIFSDRKHPLLSGFNIDDVLFANAIDNLCRVELKKRTVTVDFSSISIRELGTLYEGLLEYKFAVAEDNMNEMNTLADKNKKRLNIRRGDLYLLNQKGERKSTGSYYTPDEIVSYLVSKTVGQRIEAGLSGLDNPIEQVESLYKITVCDPAMGSGHFLVEAFDELVAAADRIVEENNLKLDMQEVRAKIARHCLYGADLNPIAVDIAKMVMWIRIFRPDKPLEFFDSNFVCGDSLTGSYDKLPTIETSQVALAVTPDQYEPEMQGVLAKRVQTLQSMPRDNMDQMKDIERYYRDEILSYQKNITFLAHLRLTKYLMPDQDSFVQHNYEEVASKLMHHNDYIAQLYKKSANPNKKQQQLMKIVEAISREFRPLHWKAQFPHVFLQGGFDVILGNPPWDIVKPNHNAFFSSYIEGYDRLETKVAKARSQKLQDEQPVIKEAYQSYLSDIARRNAFYKDAYEHQVVRDSRGRQLSGDANLYKVFTEKAYTLLKTGGMCGFVVPSGLNTDQGCTGLRRLLFDHATVHELIMFENRRGLFPSVDSRYKFDALIYEKRLPKANKFVCGFYWQDPAWLFGTPNGLSEEELSAETAIHERYTYPLELSKLYSPEMGSLLEARSMRDVPILKQIAKQPLLGDVTADWHASTYREFDMTLDAKLFNTTGLGYPLMEGKTIHQFDADFAPPTRFVPSESGEQRLAERWGCEVQNLPNRAYRIGYRSIASATNNRTLIAATLPPHVFNGNSLNLLRVVGIGSSAILLAGITALLNSFALDYVIRQRVSININSFYIKELPFIRDTKVLEQIGERALPLFAGREFRDFRGDIAEINDEAARLERRAELDAMVAKAYGLSYEQLQHVLSRFVLVDDNIKQEVLRAYRSL